MIRELFQPVPNCLAVRHCGIPLCSAVQEVSRRLRVSVPGGAVQGKVAVIRGGIDVRLMDDQLPDDVQVAVPGSVMKGRVAARVPFLCQSRMGAKHSLDPVDVGQKNRADELPRGLV